MQNSETNSAYSAIGIKPTLPIVSDWTQPQTVSGSELVRLIARANAAGFRAHRMKVVESAIYEVFFFREQTETPEPTPGPPVTSIL
jgi:hypothetical protein